MSLIHISIDEDVAELLGSSPEEIERVALEMIVLGLYRRRDISAGRAAESLGLDWMTFIRWSGELGIPYLDMTPEAWQAEVRVARKT